jgi:hypothetical protein
MPGPLPKDPTFHQRVNTRSTKAAPRPQTKKRKPPKLPIEHPHELTVAFWWDLWNSSMAAEYLESDRQGLYVLAQLVDDFWDIPTTARAAEIRQQRMALGLTPINRRRLEWSVEAVDEPSSAQTPQRVTDARQVLRAIS